MAVLYYIHDPMCSWCWGFAPVHEALIASLPADLPVKRLLGGLAPDSDVPMPEALQTRLQATWRHIQERIPGTEFNFDFWIRNTPRRSTYPACRAVIAARLQGERYDPRMTRAIQEAYYLQARNPSDATTLIELAAALGLDAQAFTHDLGSAQVERIFAAEREQSAALGAQGFPSLVLEIDGWRGLAPLDYNTSEPMRAWILARLDAARASEG